MVASNRTTCIEETLKWEGGYTNHPSDPGGPTNFGITIHDYRMYINKNGTAADVKNMTKAQAIKIYTDKYWRNAYYDCDKLAAGVDYSVYDFGVNSGPSRAKKFLDKAVGGTDEQTIIKLNDARLAWLKTLSTWSVFGKGWGTRVVGVKAKSLKMNKEKSSTTPVTPGNTAVTGGILAGMAAFIMGHKALIIVAGALLLIGGIYYYLENRKTSK